MKEGLVGDNLKRAEAVKALPNGDEVLREEMKEFREKQKIASLKSFF